MSVSSCLRSPVLGLALSAIALPLLAQDLPNLREARRLTFAPNGAVEVEYIPNDAVSANDAALLQMDLFQQQIGASVPYYGAVAMAPGMGLQSEATVAGANFHDVEHARAFALAGCEDLRRGDGPECVVVMVIRPQGWESGRALQLSAQATAALRGEYRSMGRPRAMAISDATGHWGVGTSEAAAVSDCGESDCRAVVID